MTSTQQSASHRSARTGYLILAVVSMAALCSTLFGALTISAFLSAGISPEGGRNRQVAVREILDLVRGMSAEEAAVSVVIFIGVIVSSIGVVWSVGRATYPQTEAGATTTARKRAVVSLATASVLIAFFVLIGFCFSDWLSL